MNHSPQSCASCNKQDCSMSYVSRNIRSIPAFTTYILDEVWPEYDDYIQVHSQENDPLLTLGILGKPRLSRYQWTKNTTHCASIATIKRHIAMRKVKNSTGGIRQQTYFQHDESLALQLAKNIDFRSSHLVIYQNFLPFFIRNGILGGRTFDVFMTRYPLKSLHEKLDAYAQQHPESHSIKDFRANQQLVELEWDALQKARKIITPHHDIASFFPHKTELLSWKIAQPSPHKTGDRMAFLGPTISRQGAHIAKDIAKNLSKPLIVFGNQLEGNDFWKDCHVEFRTMNAHWMDDIGGIIHPAVVTNQPRKLLSALANSITIYTNAASGLSPSHYIPIEQLITNNT